MVRTAQRPKVLERDKEETNSSKGMMEVSGWLTASWDATGWVASDPDWFDSFINVLELIFCVGESGDHLTPAEAGRPSLMEIIIAAVDGRSMVEALFWVLAAGVIFWLLSWLVDFIGLPEPMNKLAKIIVAIIAVVFCLNALFIIIRRPFISW